MNPKVPPPDNVNSVLINNFLPALFDQAKLEIAGEQVEDNQYVFLRFDHAKVLYEVKGLSD